ncbi:MAG: hypothetical protein U9Q66_02900 [Patescibacteria group bacterium]|nr:hypothetical protein [Patescibacteria group bacterium]
MTAHLLEQGEFINIKTVLENEESINAIKTNNPTKIVEILENI